MPSNEYIPSIDKIMLEYKSSSKDLSFSIPDCVVGNPQEQERDDITEYNSLKLTLGETSYNYNQNQWGDIESRVESFVKKKLKEYLNLNTVNWEVALTSIDVNWIYGEDRRKVSAYIKLVFSNYDLNNLWTVYNFHCVVQGHSEDCDLVPKFDKLADELVGYITSKLH